LFFFFLPSPQKLNNFLPIPGELHQLNPGIVVGKYFCKVSSFFGLSVGSILTHAYPMAKAGGGKG
jgi:hypothetical protein